MNNNAKRLGLLIKRAAFLTGDFTLKSGKKSKYFIDFGVISAAEDLEEMGLCYSTGIGELVGFDEFDVVFGPADKAVHIAIATSLAIKSQTGISKPYARDRKVPKDHGEGGEFIGAPFAGKRVLIVDDVVSDGATKAETKIKVEKAGGTVVATLVGVDRTDPPGNYGAAVRAEEMVIKVIMTAAELSEVLGPLPE